MHTRATRSVYTSIIFIAATLLGMLQPVQSQAFTVALSSVMKATTGNTLTVSLTPTYITPPSGNLIVSLSGAGLGCSGCSVVFSSPATGASANAAVFGGTVMTVTLTAGTFNANTLIMFTVSGFTTPNAAQAALSNVASAVTTSVGVSLGTSAAGTFPAIVDGSMTGPVITLSDVRAGGTGASMKIVVTPATAVPVNGKLLITLTGSPSLVTASVTATTGASISTPELASNVLTLTFTANTIAGGSGITITVTGFSKPAVTQVASISIAAGVTRAGGVLQSASAAGTFPAIVDGSMTGPAITLSDVRAGGTGVSMTIVVTPATAVPVNGKLLITLTGSPTLSSPSVTATTGASISAPTLLSNLLTLTFTANTIAGGADIGITVTGFRNPSSQVASISIAAGVTSSAGVLQSVSAAGTFPAIVDGSMAGPAITLSDVRAGGTGVSMTIVVTPATAVQNTGRLLITLTGSPTLSSPSVTATTGASISTSTLGLNVLTLTFTANTLAGGSGITITVTGFSNAANTQAASTSIAAGVTRAGGVLQSASAAGTFPAIVNGNMGVLAPTITLSNVIKSTAGCTMTVSLQPATAVPSNGKLVVTMRGAGLGCSGCSVVFSSPATGASASAAVISGTPPVMAVTLTAGTFSANAIMRFTVSGVTTPAGVQDALSNVASAVTSSTGVIQGASTAGTFPAIVDGDMGVLAPTITLSNVIKSTAGCTMTVSLQPATAVPSNGKLVVTMRGAGLGCSGCSVVFSSPATGASASAAVISGTPPVMAVTLTAGTFSANAIMRFTVSGVTTPAGVQDALSNVASAVTSSTGVIQGASTAGTFPGIFASYVASPAIYLSNYIRDATSVTATISFVVGSPSLSFSTVSITGLYLGSSSIIGVECFNRNPSTSIPSAALVGLGVGSEFYALTLTFTQPVTASVSAVAISCSVYGLQNAALPANFKPSPGTQISTWTAAFAPVEVSSVFAYPAIFQKSALNGAVELNSYIRGTASNVATVSFSVMCNSLNSLPAFKIISVTGLSLASYSQTLQAPVISINDTVVTGFTVAASYAAGSLSLTSSTDSFFPSTDYESLASVNISCVVSGFTNGAVQASSSPISISTWSSIPLDVQTGVLSRAIVNPLTNGAIYISTNIRSRAVVATVSFIVGTPLTAIKSISVSGVSFSAFDLSIASISCSNVGALGTISASFGSGSLVMIFTVPSVASNAAVAVQCQIGGLTNSINAVPTTASVSVWTFDSNVQPIDMQAAISQPAVFASVATSPEITLTSVIRAASAVSMGFSFISGSPLETIRTIVITGSAFAGYVSFGSIVCTNVANTGSISAEFDAPSAAVTLRFSNAATIVFSAFAVSCTLPGFTNVPQAQSSASNVIITTFNSADVPTDTAIAVAFPAIFSGSFTNPAVSLSSQIVGMSGSLFYFSVMCFSTGVPVATITVQGVSFTSVSYPLIVNCSVGSQSSSARAVASLDIPTSVLSISFTPSAIAIPSPGNLSCTVASVTNPSAVAPARPVITLSRLISADLLSAH